MTSSWMSRLVRRSEQLDPLEPEIIAVLIGETPGCFSKAAIEQALLFEITELVAPHIEAGASSKATIERVAAVVALAARSAARRPQLDDALREVVERLATVGQRARVVKGPAAAHSLYSSPLERAYNDIDLYLDPTSNIDELRALLSALDVGQQRSDALLELVRRARPLHEFTAHIGGVMIDVHFNPFGLVSPVIDGRALTARFAPRGDFDVPDPELGLLVTLVNLTRKGGGALWLVADALRYAERADRIVLAELASRERVRGIAERGLHRIDLLRVDSAAASVPTHRALAIPEPDTAGMPFRQTRIVLQRERSATTESVVALLRWYLPGRLQRAARRD